MGTVSKWSDHPPRGIGAVGARWVAGRYFSMASEELFNSFDSDDFFNSVDGEDVDDGCSVNFSDSCSDTDVQTCCSFSDCNGNSSIFQKPPSFEDWECLQYTEGAAFWYRMYGAAVAASRAFQCCANDAIVIDDHTQELLARSGFSNGDEVHPGTLWRCESSRLHREALKVCQLQWQELKENEKVEGKNVARPDSIVATMVRNKPLASEKEVLAEEKSWETLLWVQSLAKAEKKLRCDRNLKPDHAVPDKLQYKLNESACAMFRAKKKKLKMKIQKKKGNESKVTDDDYNVHLGLIEGGCI